jgi:hypothetical protein
MMVMIQQANYASEQKDNRQRNSNDHPHGGGPLGGRFLIIHLTGVIGIFEITFD